MQMSARILGLEYGLTAEEMNRVLLKLGFLTGEPGNYIPTEKALKYVVEHSFHRGCGGYSQYNRFWDTITFDESIKNVLHVTAELKSEIRAELAAARAARAAAQAAAKAKAEAAFLAKRAAEEAARAAEEEAVLSAVKRATTLKKVATGGLIGVGALGLIYGAYKATPHIKKLLNERKKPSQDSIDTDGN